MEVYRTGEMNLDQLMAFAISDDHAAQERVWFESPLYDRHPQTIRRLLTKALVDGGDRRARFVGAEAYETAGGTVIRDLFRPEDDGYFTDSTLLDRLVAEKLAAEADKVKAEGWSWVDARPETDYAYLSRLLRIPPTAIPLSDEEQARLDELTNRYDALIEELGEDPPAEADAELSRLQGEIDALTEGREQWSPEEMAKAGAIVALDYHGAIIVERGLVKAETGTGDQLTEATDQAKPKERPSQPKPSLPDALVEELTTHRTAALQAVLASQPDLAFAALVHTLALRTFYGVFHETCLDVTPEAQDLGRIAETVRESEAVAAMLQKRREWLDLLPAEDKLWSWLVEQDHGTKLALLAFCTATTVNAVKRKHDRDDSARLVHADILAGAGGLDMADWWEATQDTYFVRVSKSLILEAVAEGVSKEAAENIAAMKKDAMAVRAEERLSGRRWLPQILRARSIKHPTDGQEEFRQE
jgi:ParB family chromosome partitioning protein